MELLKELCESSGIPGFEERLRAIVRRELEPVVDEMRVGLDVAVAGVLAARSAIAASLSDARIRAVDAREPLLQVGHVGDVTGKFLLRAALS